MKAKGVIIITSEKRNFFVMKLDSKSESVRWFSNLVYFIAKSVKISVKNWFNTLFKKAGITISKRSQPKSLKTCFSYRTTTNSNNKATKIMLMIIRTRDMSEAKAILLYFFLRE